MVVCCSHSAHRSVEPGGEFLPGISTGIAGAQRQWSGPRANSGRHLGPLAHQTGQFFQASLTDRQTRLQPGQTRWQALSYMQNSQSTVELKPLPLMSELARKVFSKFIQPWRVRAAAPTGHVLLAAICKLL